VARTNELRPGHVERHRAALVRTRGREGYVCPSRGVGDDDHVAVARRIRVSRRTVPCAAADVLELWILGERELQGLRIRGTRRLTGPAFRGSAFARGPCVVPSRLAWRASAAWHQEHRGAAKPCPQEAPPAFVAATHKECFFCSIRCAVAPFAFRRNASGAAGAGGGSRQRIIGPPREADGRGSSTGTDCPGTYGTWMNPLAADMWQALHIVAACWKAAANAARSLEAAALVSSGGIDSRNALAIVWIWAVDPWPHVARMFGSPASRSAKAPRTSS
jgi:hypothetical protein